MDQFRELLLDVWREACQHIEIEASTAMIAPILTQQLPLDRLGVVELDWTRGQAIRRAVALSLMGEELATTRPWSRGQRERVRRWADANAISSDTEHPEILPLLLTGAEHGHWLAGVLREGDHPSGALLLRASPSATFEPKHEQMLRRLLEPFSAALANDRRLHELEFLREAAEAEKRSALSRLGRDSLRDTIIGEKGGLRQVMQRVELVARSDIPVLILGETGAGKEVIARAIHDHSPRREGPFIRVNCGAIPAELIDSELFGHEKGAFTGATDQRRGWFERANEGTLLLDEVGELPLPAQVRLLRVLQEGTFERVGGEQSIRVDVRIVAATHRDLPVMVQHGQFREDLWYRVSGFPIVLPPLRERKEDIPDLANHFAHQAAQRFGLRAQPPSEHDFDLLRNYSWPGNIRELAAVIDRAAILGEGQRLELTQAIGQPSNHRPAEAPNPKSTPSNQTHLLSLDELQRQHIEHALSEANGRIEGPRGIASQLEINPHTLRARMRKLGINWRSFR